LIVVVDTLPEGHKQVGVCGVVPGLNRSTVSLQQIRTQRPGALADSPMLPPRLQRPQYRYFPGRRHGRARSIHRRSVPFFLAGGF
jgi:hypothetical protein